MEEGRAENLRFSELSCRRPAWSVDVEIHFHWSSLAYSYGNLPSLLAYSCKSIYFAWEICTTTHGETRVRGRATRTRPAPGLVTFNTCRHAAVQYRICPLIGSGSRAETFETLTLSNRHCAHTPRSVC